MNTLDEKDLLEKIKSGDTAAFGDFIDIYKRLVSHIVYRMIPRLGDREDLCQDIFIKVYQNIEGFLFKSKVSTWVGRIAYNTCLNYLEKKKMVLYDDISSEHQTLDSFSSKNIRPDEYVEKGDISKHLDEQLAQLPVLFRTVLTLYHLDGMSYAEISDIMGKPEGTVKSYLFRGRKYLKDLIIKSYNKEEIWH